ncbi:uncharacterized protein PV06_04532 [Exophiala oligosperma]|uniref:Inheritance of peroxisomes protein 1 n=1 Tax=Exophiala oligosperma TaxID=215243 RepID=A0A0D2DLX3_9EURO|nr:uncharacterized protein PV06_04532 [Exophiala oligosperma]KIW43425.1 hypothetical protein PV06_04532 [Exophiala oligosperma]
MATHSYGDRPPLQGFRRSFTLPARQLSVHERAGLDRSDADANVLFSHPSARIIAFSPPKESIPAQNKDIPPDTDYPVDTIETLPWRSRTETLAATGQIMIEKVRGSSNFLKSADQKVIHTIMRNSQCWCVDGESKFVLRTGKFRYYRIELPSETQEDKQKVEELKTVLSKVLRYERTPCPFKRAFHVDLPEDAITPRRKGVWKRRPPSQPTSPSTDPLPLRRSKTSRAWSLQGPTSSTPLHTYGRRGSDYGYSLSRDTSPIPSLEGDRWRPSTPSSLASSEMMSDRAHEESYSQDDEGHSDNPSPMPEDHVLTAESDLQSNSRSSSKSSIDRQSDHATEVESTALRDIDHTESDIISQAHPVEIAAKEDPSANSVTTDVPSIAEDGHTAGDQSHNEKTESFSHRLEDNSDQTGSTKEEPDSQEFLQVTEESVVPEEESSPEQLSPPADPAPASAQAEISSASSIDEYASESQPASDIANSDPISTQNDSQKEKVSIEAKQSLLDLNAVDEAEEPSKDDDARSSVSSLDSFHTTNSLAEDFSEQSIRAFDTEKTPKDEKFDPFSLSKPQHKRGVSEMTITASNVDARQSADDSSDKPSTPALGRSPTSDSSWPEVCTPESPVTAGLRRRLEKKRSLSPLPPSTTIFSPPSPTQGNHFTSEILHKACNIALVKPIEAVVLLVHILARIAGGATVSDLLSGDLFRKPDQHRRRSSFPDQVSSRHHGSDDEDDFGIPIRRRRSLSDSPRMSTAISNDNDTDSMFDLD